uniref:Uncharacterized protein n=1 Tax=Mycena chlorophos TaxID=658473 RepID=A0ABQ0KZI4_MYCCL|nr:predicted protein [Mycena chlorophos]
MLGREGIDICASGSRSQAEQTIASLSGLSEPTPAIVSGRLTIVLHQQVLLDVRPQSFDYPASPFLDESVALADPHAYVALKACGRTTQALVEQDGGALEQAQTLEPASVSRLDILIPSPRPFLPLPRLLSRPHYPIHASLSPRTFTFAAPFYAYIAPTSIHGYFLRRLSSNGLFLIALLHIHCRYTTIRRRNGWRTAQGRLVEASGRRTGGRVVAGAWDPVKRAVRDGRLVGKAGMPRCEFDTNDDDNPHDVEALTQAQTFENARLRLVDPARRHHSLSSHPALAWTYPGASTRPRLIPPSNIPPTRPHTPVVNRTIPNPPRAPYTLANPLRRDPILIT